MQEINLYDLIRFYVKKWPFLILFVLIGALSGHVYNNYVQTPLYKSDATLLLVDSEKAQASQDAVLINNYVELFKSRRVLGSVINQQKLDISYEALLAKTAATNQKDTEVIKVSIAARDAKVSQQLADGAVVAFKVEAAKLYGSDNVEIVDKANRPTQPYNVNKPMQLALATAAGLFAALVSLFFAYDYSMNKKHKKPASIKKIKRV